MGVSDFLLAAQHRSQLEAAALGAKHQLALGMMQAQQQGLGAPDARDMQQFTGTTGAANSTSFGSALGAMLGAAGLYGPPANIFKPAVPGPGKPQRIPPPPYVHRRWARFGRWLGFLISSVVRRCVIETEEPAYG